MKKLTAVIMILFTSMSLFSSQVSANEESPAQDQLEQAEAYVHEQFKKAGIVGGSYAIVFQDQLLAAGGTGYSDQESQAEATEETIYSIASVTKPFTATAIHQLHEQGKLDTGNPVQDYIPWFRYADKELSKQVTIKHLLTQAAGVSRIAADGSIFEDEEKNRHSLENAVKALRTVPMNAVPGEKGQYCNTCYNTLGLLIEKVSGMSYYDYMNQFVFQPLEMEQTGYGPDLDKIASAGIAKEYSYLFGFSTDRFVNYSTFGKSQDPEGGIYTNALDLAKFASASLGYSEGKLLSQNLQSHMFEGEVLSEQAPWQYTSGAYAVGEIAGEKVVYKGGDGIGSTSGLWLLPEKELGIVLLAGESTDSVYDIGVGLIELLSGGHPGPIEYSAGLFQLIGYFSLILLIISLLLITAVGTSTYRRVKMKNKTVKHRFLTSCTSVLLLALSALLIYLLFTARPSQAGFYGFPLDLAAGLMSLAVSLLIAALYSICLSVMGHSNSMLERTSPIA